MLIISRRKEETIQIGEEIVIKVLKIGASVVKIGIEAPPDCKILRGELTPFGFEPPAEIREGTELAVAG